MFGYASRLPPLLVFLAGIWLLLFVYPKTTSGFRVRNANSFTHGNVRKEQDAETSSVAARSANNPASLKEKRRGVALTNCQSEHIREINAAMERSHEPVIIDITDEQKAEIIAIYGSYFRENESLKGTLESMATNRVSRQAVDVEVCPRIPSWDDLIIMKSSDGRLLQVVQFSNDDLKQWMLQETCEYPVSNVVDTVSCAERERLIRAVVIDPDISLITETDVVVYCCAAYTRL